MRTHQLHDHAHPSGGNGALAIFLIAASLPFIPAELRPGEPIWTVWFIGKTKVISGQQAGESSTLLRLAHGRRFAALPRSRPSSYRGRLRG